MNQMREGLMGREAQLKDSAQDQALLHAKAVLSQIKDQPAPFYKAHDDQAVAMARKHCITETGAKSIMKNAHNQSEGRSLYDAGKERETAHYTPIVEAARSERATRPVITKTFSRQREHTRMINNSRLCSMA